MSTIISELAAKIEYHNKRYWEDNEPEISDEVYDELIQQLRNSDPNHPLLIKTQSPVSVSGRAKIKHIIPMLSLDKAYTVHEMLTWARKIARSSDELFDIQPKYDGCSVDFRQDRKLVTAGDDGIYGLDITDKMPIIKVSHPNGSWTLADCPIPVRGEAIITKYDFRHNKEYLIRKDGKPYKTERNAVAALLNQKETPNIPPVITLKSFNSINKRLSLAEMEEYDWEGMREFVQKDLEYPTDGIVIKLVDEDYSKSLGATSHHPIGQIALKHGNPVGRSKLVNVEWQIGKQRTLNPVAIIEPVEIFGHTITKANLHNGKRILDLDLHIGDTVVIERCGEIIPDIIEVIPSDKRSKIVISDCPRCGGPVNYREPFMYCASDNCTGHLAKRLTDTCQRIGLDRVGLGTAEKLTDYGCRNILDILNLSMDDLLCLDGFAETSASNLMSEINKIKQTPIEDWKLLSSLNIEGIGSTLSKQILKSVTIKELMDMIPEDLNELPMIGMIRANEIYDSLDGFRDLITQIYNILTITDSKYLQQSSKGKICITGKPPSGKKYWEELAEKKGFESVKSVTKDLKYLITSDPNSTSGKALKAQKFGIEVISVEKFKQILGI